MKTFKVGDRVIELKPARTNGRLDRGTVVSKRNDEDNTWWVLWEYMTLEPLWVHGNDIELLEDTPKNQITLLDPDTLDGAIERVMADHGITTKKELIKHLINTL